MNTLFSREKPMKDSSSTCQAIQAASTEAQVIAIVREYFAGLSPEKAAYVPTAVLKVGMNYAQDVAQAALEIANREAHAEPDAPEAALLRDVGIVLSTAAMRLVVLACGAEAQTAHS
jgi:hypothetical protein